MTLLPQFSPSIPFWQVWRQSGKSLTHQNLFLFCFIFWSCIKLISQCRGRRTWECCKGAEESKKLSSVRELITVVWTTLHNFTFRLRSDDAITSTMSTTKTHIPGPVIYIALILNGYKLQMFKTDHMDLGLQLQVLDCKGSLDIQFGCLSMEAGTTWNTPSISLCLSCWELLHCNCQLCTRHSDTTVHHPHRVSHSCCTGSCITVST